MRRPDDLRERLGTLFAGGTVGVLLAYLAFRAGGVAAGVAAAVSVAAGLILLARARRRPADIAHVARVATASQLALPGALVVYLAFNAGGFYPRTSAFVALVLALVLVLRVTLAEEPFPGFSGMLAAAAVGLSLYCLWTLISGVWSDTPARGLLEFDRALAYLLALLVLGSLERTPTRLRWALRSVALGMAIVAVAGLLTRLWPDAFETASNLAAERLSFPLTYWNALGILATLGTILCLHLASDAEEPPAARIAGASAVPALATTVLFTFSRGAIAAGLGGLVLYCALGRPRSLVTGALAAVPATVVALVAAYDADLLATTRPTTAATVQQGHGLALVLALCVAGAALVRALLLRLDAPLERLRLPERHRMTVLGVASAAALVVLIALGATFDVPERVRNTYEGFVSTTDVRSETDVRMRLLDPANSGRIDNWSVAVEGFEQQPIRGLGAGTYSDLWTTRRPRSAASLAVRDAHSLYLESLAELGLVGFVLLAVTLLVVIASFAPVRRGRDRALYGALFAAALAWAVHAAFDWDWEMPAVTIWLFALGGLALAAPPGRGRRFSPRRGGRVTLGLALLTLAVAPLVVLVSDRRLDRAAAAFTRGDCARATAAATASIEVLEIRAEPYEVVALCQARRGNYSLAITALREAIERDPRSWELHYDLALVQAAAGLDPRGAARSALRLNPQDPLTRALALRLSRGGPSQWRRELTPVLDRINLSVIR